MKIYLIAEKNHLAARPRTELTSLCSNIWKESETLTEIWYPCFVGSFFRRWFEMQNSMISTVKLLCLVLVLNLEPSYHELALVDNVYYYKLKSQSQFCELQLILDILSPIERRHSYKGFFPFQSHSRLRYWENVDMFANVDGKNK